MLEISAFWLVWLNRIFLVAFLLFSVLDIIMLVSLLKPGDERNQIIVWKAGSTTLFVTAASMLLELIANLIIRRPHIIGGTLYQLGVAVVTYFIVLMYYKKRHGG